MRNFNEHEWSLIRKYRTINLEPTAYEDVIRQFSSRLLTECGVDIAEEGVVIYDTAYSVTSYIEGFIINGEKFLSTVSSADTLTPTFCLLAKHTHIFGALRVLYESPSRKANGQVRHYPHSMRVKLVGTYPMFHNAFNYYNNDPTDVRWQTIEKLNEKLNREQNTFFNIIKQQFTLYNKQLDHLLDEALEHWTHPEQVWSTIQSLQLDKEEPEELEPWQQETRHNYLNKLKRSA